MEMPLAREQFHTPLETPRDATCDVPVRRPRPQFFSFLPTFFSHLENFSSSALARSCMLILRDYR